MAIHFGPLDLRPDASLIVSTAVLLFLRANVSCLEVTPHDGQLILATGSSITITCSSSGETAWEFKRDDVPYFQVEQGQNGVQSYQIVQDSVKSSSLSLWNVSWKHTGVYQCIDRHTGERKEVDVFVPGLDFRLV